MTETAPYPIAEVQGLYRTIAELRQQVAEMRKELVIRKARQDVAERAARTTNRLRAELHIQRREKA